MSSYPYYNEPSKTRGTIVTGARDTSVSNTEGRLVVDAVDKVYLLEPNQNPFVTLLTNVGKDYDGKTWKGVGIQKAVAENPEFKVFEDFHGGRYAKVSGTYAASGAVTITVSGAGSSSGYIFTVGDVIKNARTGEVMEVETVASATTITVAAAARGLGSSAAAAGADADGLYIIGNANEEGAGARNVNTTVASAQTNYCQIFRTSISFTRTDSKSTVYGEKDPAYQRKKKGLEHAMDIERALWFGEKSHKTGANGKPKRYTGGVLEFINQGNAYVQNQGGPLTRPDFNTFLREGFSYGSTRKKLFCGGIVLQAINEIALGQLQIVTGADSYGVTIKRWVTAFGEIDIVHNPLFVNDYAGYAFLLDMNSFRYRYMEGSDTQLRMNIQANDADGQADEFLTECGLERNLSAQNALLKGCTD